MIKVIYQKLKWSYIDEVRTVKAGMNFIQKNNKPKEFYGYGVYDDNRNILYIPAVDNRQARSQIIDSHRKLGLDDNHIFENVRLFSPFPLKN